MEISTKKIIIKLSNKMNTIEITELSSKLELKQSIVNGCKWNYNNPVHAKILNRYTREMTELKRRIEEIKNQNQ